MKKKKRILKMVVVLVLLVVLPLSVFLVKKVQENRSKATSTLTNVTGGSYTCGTGHDIVWYCQPNSSTTFWGGDGNTCVTGTTTGNWVKTIYCTPGLCLDKYMGAGNYYQAGCLNPTDRSKFDILCQFGKCIDMRKKIDGECSDSQANRCKSGIVDLKPNDTNTQILWTCMGVNGGATRSCERTSQSGECDYAAGTNKCKAGTVNFKPDDIKDSSGNVTTVRWTCMGVNGGADKFCSLDAGPINGVCGTKSNQCQRGKFLDATDTATQIKWICQGTNGGKDKNCMIANSTNGRVDGKCNTTKPNDCIYGNQNNNPPDIKDSSGNVIQVRWTCIGVNGGTTASCSYISKVDGKCSNITGKCDSGTPTSVTVSNSGFSWSCIGKNGGQNKQCFIYF